MIRRNQQKEAKRHEQVKYRRKKPKVHKYVKRLSILLVRGRGTLRYHFTAIGLARTKKSDDSKFLLRT